MKTVEILFSLGPFLMQMQHKDVALLAFCYSKTSNQDVSFCQMAEAFKHFS